MVMTIPAFNLVAEVNIYPTLTEKPKCSPAMTIEVTRLVQIYIKDE